MKLLLTSGGVTNKSIAKALFELVGKKPEETTIVFIPTAMNVCDGHKGWFVDDLSNLKNLNLKCLDIVDISALPKNISLERIQSADVIFFSGGNTAHLMFWIKESGLAELLPELLKTKVYASISAGSIVAGPTIELSSDDALVYYEENFNYADKSALGLVNFHIRPHLNSRSFPKARKDYLESIAKDFNVPIYGIDDQSALKVVDGNIEVISEGEWIKFN